MFEGGPLLHVETSDRDPLHYLALGHSPAVPTTVAGQPGWLMEDDRGSFTLTQVVWRAGNSVTVLLQVFADGAEALRMAEDVRLVDEAEWRATYPEAADALTPTATTAPAPTTSPGG